MSVFAYKFKRRGVKRLPTEESVKIALRTQQVLAYETGVTKTVDPLAGSYYIEYLTEQIIEGVNCSLIDSPFVG